MHVENLLSFVRSSKSGGGVVSALLCLSVNEVRTNLSMVCDIKISCVLIR